jgi:hypothetical protein
VFCIWCQDVVLLKLARLVALLLGFADCSCISIIKPLWYLNLIKYVVMVCLSDAN